MIYTFSIVIFYCYTTLLNINKLKVRGGLDNVAGKSGAYELNLIVNERFICINPLFQGFICIAMFLVYKH